MQYLSYNFKENEKTRKIFACIFWILTALCMIMIFMFSAQNGKESQALSDGFSNMFLSFLNNIVDINIIRKFAHFFEYASLAFLSSTALFFTKKDYSCIWALVLSVLYSISDEVHQLFVPERAGRVFDVFVDSSGAATGILVFTLLLLFINLIIIKSGRGKLK